MHAGRAAAGSGGSGRRCTLLLAAAAASIALRAEAQALRTEDEKTFYALGAGVARRLEVFDLSPRELEVVKRGFSDAAARRPLLVDPADYQKRIDKLASDRAPRIAARQRQRAQGVLEQAAREKGAERSSSGLVYVPVAEGRGEQARKTDTATVRFTGRLVDGRVFDSSANRGRPAEFKLDAVIPCWTEGIGKMKVGGKAKLVCPPEIAYGDFGRPPRIPPGATLVFEVELLGVKR